MRFEFHPEALEEYRQATLWYAERDLTLALQFIGSVEDAIKANCGCSDQMVSY
jgi:hypothetical protein